MDSNFVPLGYQTLAHRFNGGLNPTSKSTKVP